MTESERQLSSILSEFARTLLTDFPIQAILDHLVQRIVEVLPVSAAGVTLISPTTAPHYIAASNDSALRFEELQAELGEGPCLASYRSGTSVSVQDLRTESRFTSFVPRGLEIGLAAVFAFPLRHGPDRFGALDLYRDTPGSLGQEEMVTAQILADVASAYLLNAKARADLQDSTDQFRERSFHDALTGLPNRMLLLERIQHAIVRNGRSDKVVAVIFADLDEFKRINDTHGHQVGDQLLIAVAARIGALLRPADTLARPSGDEFVVLCEDLDGMAQVEMVADRIVDALATPFDLPGLRVQVAGSVGIALAEGSCHDADQLLHTADLAMYQAKRKGGSRHQIIDLGAQRGVECDMSLRSALGGAVERKELRMEYQPIVSADNGRVGAVEALLRWDHPVRGAVPPGSIMPLAELSGHSDQIGRWALHRACLDGKDLGHLRGGDLLRVEVNVSPRQLMAPEFVEMVGDVLADTQLAPDRLVLEISEGVVMTDTTRALTALSGLKQLGVRLALDDFGTGYASFSCLKRFPVDIVKIDRSFVTDLVSDRPGHAITAKTIELAHLLDLAVVCQGVDTEDQFQAIVEMGGDFGQGDYFSGPKSCDALDLAAAGV
jgi:diguanylate cyclase (GGDEF)-like protein